MQKYCSRKMIDLCARFQYLRFNVIECCTMREGKTIYYDLMAPCMITTHQSNNVTYVPKTRSRFDGSFGSKRNEAERTDERMSRSRMRVSLPRVSLSRGKHVELDHTFSLGWLTYWHWHCDNVMVERNHPSAVIFIWVFCIIIIDLASALLRYRVANRLIAKGDYYRPHNRECTLISFSFAP